MLEDFTCDFLLQECKGVQDNSKVKKKKIDYQDCEECYCGNNYVSSFGILCMPELWCVWR